MKRTATLFAIIALFITACNNDKEKDSTEATASSSVAPPAVMNYTLVKIYPHDTSSFIEGLQWHDNALYESSGDPYYVGTSRLSKINLETGKPLQQVRLNKTFFAEGITILKNKIYQLTYKEHKVFVYDMNFKKTAEFEWPYEGWGMTTDGTYLIIDTGGSNLYFVNPETFKIERTLGVIDNNGYVGEINELEYVDGYIYANIWRKDDIIRINPKTGLVEARADLSQLLEKNNQPKTPETDVLNGIAYDSTKKSFYITGKYWPALFEVRFN